MDDTYTMIVKLVEAKDCIVRIHRKLLNKFPLCILRVVIGGEFSRPHYFATLEHDERNSEFIHFPQVLGQQLGLVGGSIVQVKLIKERITDCYCCYLTLVEPRGVTLDSHREELTNGVLNQIRVVYPDLIFPFWTVSGDVLFFKVNQIRPDVDFALLVQDSLVDIGDERSESSPKVSSVADKFRSLLSYFNPALNSVNTSATGDSSDAQSEFDCVDTALRNRVICRDIGKFSYRKVLNVIPHSPDLDASLVYNTIWVNPLQFNISEDGDEFAVALVYRLLSPCEKAKKSEHKRPVESTPKRIDSIGPKEEEIFLSTYVLVKASSSCPTSCSFVCDNLRKQMDISYSCKIFLRRPNFKSIIDNGKECQAIPIKNVIYFCPLEIQSSLSPDSAKTSLKLYTARHKVLIISRGSCIDVSGQKFIIACDPEDPCIALNENILENIEIRTKNSNCPRITTSWGKRLPLMKIPENFQLGAIGDQLNVYLPYPFIPWMERQLELALSFLRRIFNQGPDEPARISFSRNVLLIQGPKGSGKSSFLREILQTLKQESSTLFTRTIHCGSWKTISALKKQWSTLVAESVYYQPSVLVFEDLDLVAPHISRLEEVPSNDTIASIRAACTFSSIIKSFDELTIKFGCKVAIIATCQSESTLNPILVPLRGKPVFSDTISLENPNIEQRKQILEAFIKFHCDSSASLVYPWLNDIAQRCEGFLITDLVNLVDSAIHQNLSDTESPGVSQSIFEDILQDFRPSMMSGVRIEEKSSFTFKDVGGLGNVKNILRSTLLLPIKYPILFSKCPIRPPRNILLYGAPGTGKSLIAEALASESKVNLIKVRGPELLSKYIGRSEESIRELFERASVAKPCIIFFDEFESLAPRRGQDTTGVTDRVVNQLLAQMDGVEVIEQGVYAIAATSRPDLLDPALLRPGRFDKCILCDFPLPTDRLDIWKVLGKNLSFSSSFNHDIIPELTEDFTGADIRALLINAQYEAIEEFETSNLKNEPISSESNGTIIIEERHVRSARSKTKPGIDSNKRSEYRYIYNRFSGIEAATLPTHQRATLA